MIFSRGNPRILKRMRLQRIAVYRATRILSWVLPVVIFVFIGIAIWSYWSRRRDTQAEIPAPQELPSGIAVVTKDVKYVVSVSGKDQFQVRADEMQVSRDNRSFLRGVEVVIYARKPGDSDRRIFGDTCTHDKATQQVDCKSNVSVELEPGTIARTEELSYEASAGLITSNVRTALDRKGEMTGSAGKMDYFVESGLMRLTDGFVIELIQGGAMRGGIGVFQYKENWATVSNGVELTSTDARIHGGSGRAELAPGTYRARKITVESGAGAEAPSFVVNSDWLSADLSDAGAVEHVLGRGNVHAEHLASKDTSPTAGAEDAGLHGTLKGPEVEAWLGNGRVTVIEARERPEFSSTSGTLRAQEKLRIEPSGPQSGDLRTQGISSFTGAALPLAIEGRDFLIRVKDNEQVFSTASRATLKSSGMTTVADRTEARLDTKTNTLTEMEQSGKVTFEEDKSGRRGAAGRLSLRNGGDRIELEGDKPWFEGAQGTLNARKITFDRETDSFVGDGNVQMVSAETGGKPRVVNAGHAEGNAVRMEFTGNVEMYPGDGKIEADQLILYGKESRFEAKGKVHSKISELEVWAGTLDVSQPAENRQIAHYAGDVRAEKKDKDGILELRGQDLNVHLRNGEKGGQLDRIIAAGRVEMVQGARSGRGDRLEYNAVTRETLLVGTEKADAEVNERGTGQFVKGCIILMMADGSKTVKTCGGVVTSSFKVNN